MTEYYDNTRVSTFKTCPRKFFFRHVKHWVADGNKAALAFGAAWHSAQEVIWPAMIKGLPKNEIAKLAFIAFVQEWTDQGFPHPDEIGYELEKELAPRTPGTAFEMILDYIDNRIPKVKDLELISVERPFIVPLDPDDDSVFYVGKIDKVVRQRGKVRAVEHKTTTLYKKDGGFRSTFIDGFSPNSQVDGYLYALHMLWPGQVQGVWIDGALVHRNETAFMFIPVEKQEDQLHSWLWETRYWIDQIQAHKAALEECSPEDPFMAAFPRQTGSCQDYNTNCEYRDICRFKANPLSITEVPGGFHEEVWDPLKETGAFALLGQEDKK